MLNSDKLAFVELQKTGSTGLKKFLGNIVGGEASGKTAVYAGELLALGKPVVGLVCHPLTWYLDQWKQGCAGKGELYKRLVDEKRWDLLRSRQTNRPARAKQGKADPKAIPAEWGAEHAKTRWYADVENVDAFHEWLYAVAAARGIRNLIDRGYQVSPVSNVGGLMTYHFVIRFVRDGENLERSVDTLDALRETIAQHAITPHFVRAEHAGEDLLKVLDAVGVQITDEQRTQALAFKRRGADTKLIRRYYDDASLRLVAEREALMLELFDYEIAAPAVTAGKKAKKDKKDPAAREAAKAAKAARGDKPAKAPKAQKADKPAKAKKAAQAGDGDDAKPSKQERAQQRELRAERRAARQAQAGAAPDASAREAGAEAAAEPPAKPPKAARPPKADKVDKADKPAKVKRVKNRPVDEDVVENET